MVLDSTIVRILDNFSKEPGPVGISALYDFLVIFFIVSNFVFIRYLRQQTILAASRESSYSKYSLNSITIIQLILCAIIVVNAIEFNLTNSNHLAILEIALYFSFLTGIVFLAFITYQFFRWFKTKQQYITLIYAMAFMLLLTGVIISLVYVADRLTFIKPVLTLKTINAVVASNQSPSILMNNLSTIYDFSSIAAFFLLWIGTIIQLKGYALKVGKVRYNAMIIAPLVFYMFPLMADQTNIFDNARLEYGSQFNLIYIIVFSPYKQVGGLLFGIVFWLTAFRITRANLRNTLQMAGTGMMILFGSAVLHGLSFIMAPPFGVVTIAYFGLASYMLSTGIYLSSRELAKDAIVRRELYRLTGEQSGLLKTTSSAEIEKELNKNVQAILVKIKDEEPNSIQVAKEDDPKEIVEEVLRELESMKKKN